jgi:hypothetical protein
MRHSQRAQKQGKGDRAARGRQVGLFAPGPAKQEPSTDRILIRKIYYHLAG